MGPTLRSLTLRGNPSCGFGPHPPFSGGVGVVVVMVVVGCCWFGLPGPPCARPPDAGPPLPGPPKISLFFFPSPASFSFFSPSLVGPFVEFWWCF